MLRRPDASDLFDRFLAERGLVLLSMERINGERSRVVILQDGRALTVSYQGSRPTRRTLQKLDYAVRERAP